MPAFTQEETSEAQYFHGKTKDFPPRGIAKTIMDGIPITIILVERCLLNKGYVSLDKSKKYQHKLQRDQNCQKERVSKYDKS